MSSEFVGLAFSSELHYLRTTRSITTCDEWLSMLMMSICLDVPMDLPATLT